MIYDNKHVELDYDKVNGKPIFIFYDNKHIIGIDIKQPSIMKGLAIINESSRKTDVGQGIYRLRNLNIITILYAPI